MELLKGIFGDKALTFAELEKALEGNEKIKLANLSGGDYVGLQKFKDKETELTTANATIKNLQDSIKKFDGVDVEALKKTATDWESKYNADISTIKRDSAVSMAIMQAKGKNPKAIQALLDMENIKVKADGTLEGLDLEALKKSDGYLFDIETVTKEGTGLNGGTGSAGKTVTKEQFNKMGYKEKNEIYQNDKELYDSFMS